MLQIFLKVSPKFFKNLRRVTFKCTASLKWHFYFYIWTFWDENRLRPKAFSLWTTRGLRSMVLEIEPLFSKWRQTSEFSALNNNDHLLVQVFSCCARVVFIQGRSQMFLAILKSVVLFQTIELKPRVVHLKKRVGVGEGERLAHRVKFSSCYLLSLTSKHWNFLFYDVLQNQRLLQTAKVVRKLPRNLWLRLFVPHFNAEWTGIRTLAEVIK